jgi:hypothetical protein
MYNAGGSRAASYTHYRFFSLASGPYSYALNVCNSYLSVCSRGCGSFAFAIRRGRMFEN